MVTKCSFDATKNKRDYGRGRACIEMLSKTLRDRAMEIINYEEQEMIPQMKKISLMKSKKYVIYAKKCFVLMKMMEIHLNYKVRDHCHYTGKFRGAAHSICNLRYKVPKGIPVMVHNCSSFDDHFIIKQLAKELDGQFESLG